MLCRNELMVKQFTDYGIFRRKILKTKHNIACLKISILLKCTLKTKYILVYRFILVVQSDLQIDCSHVHGKSLLSSEYPSENMGTTVNLRYFTSKIEYKSPRKNSYYTFS